MRWTMAKSCFGCRFSGKGKKFLYSRVPRPEMRPPPRVLIEEADMVFYHWPKAEGIQS